MRSLQPAPRSGSAADALTVLAPLLAILSLLGMLAALLWLFDRDERSKQHDDLIRDALWVEQALQFQFKSEQERLTRFAADLEKAPLAEPSFVIKARQIRQIARDIADLVLIDGKQAILDSASGAAAPQATFAPDIAAGRDIVRAGLGGAFTAPYQRLDGKIAIAFVVPLRPEPATPQALIAVFELDTMLAEFVPWWIAQRRAVQIADGVGNRLVSRSQVTPDSGSDSYSVQIGPPVHDISLTVVSYGRSSSLAQNGLVGAMVLLGFLAIAGLVARERQLRRRKAAEAALDDEHALRRALENSALVGMQVRDMGGRLLYVNPAFCRMVGYDAGELIGLDPPMPYWVPEDMDRAWRLHDQLLAGHGAGQGTELTFQDRTGKRFEVLLYEEPLVDAAGNQRGWIGSALDISDRKRVADLEREQAAKLQHTARLVTMGEIASLIAHDLNQPLATIRGFQAGLLNSIEKPEFPREMLEPALRGIGEAAERAGRIVRGVHDFVKKSEPKLVSLDLAGAVAETLALIAPEIRTVHAIVDTDLPADLPPVRADRVLIEQVLVNLVRNALEAVATRPIEQRHIRIGARRDGPRVEVSIADSGPGVTPEIAANLFRPFVSTKRGGMGMGLSICRSILEVHGGHIRYAATPAGGAQFSFTLEASGDSTA